MSQRLLAQILLLLAGLALPRPARADVRVVGPSPAPYAEIQAAVDAANDGDVVLVKAGTYASFVVRNQELAIVADAGAVVNVDGAIRVSGLAATRSVLLSGLRAVGTRTTNAQSRHGLYAHNCVGSLRVVGCELTGVPSYSGIFFVGPNQNYPVPLPSCYEGQGAYVDGCDDVAFVGCTLRGSDAPPATGYGGYGTRPHAGAVDGGHGLYGAAAQLALCDSQLLGGRAGLWNASCEPPPSAPVPSYGYGYIGAAGEGCRTTGSFVFGSNCTFTGAPGWTSTCLGQCFCVPPSDGGNALVHGTAPLAAQLLGCALAFGPGGIPNNGPCPCGIGGNFCPPFPSGAPGVAAVGAVNVVAGNARRLTATPVAREGQTVALAFTGQPGDRVELLRGDRPGFQYLASARGVVLVQRTRPQRVLQVGTIGASGVLTQSFLVSELGAGVQSSVVWMQALMTDGANQTTLSSPAVVVLLDAAF